MIAQTRCVRRAVALSLAFLLTGSQIAYAGDLLDAAMAKASAFSAASVAVQNTCQDAALQGEADGREQQGSGGWFAGGLLLTTFLVPVIPIVAHIAEPTPRADALSEISSDDLSCYTTGYVRTAKGKRVRASWVGYGVSVITWIAIFGAAG